MKNKSLISKIIAITGTILVWIPIIAPVLLTIIFLIIKGRFAFDFLMPMELIFLVIIGAILLIISSIIMKFKWKIIGISLGTIISIFILGQFIAEITGIASGETEMTSTLYFIMITFVIIYIISLIILGISGITLVKKF
jgi:hypothetical protein